MVPLPPGEAVLLDELGSKVIETLPAAEQAVVLELGGELVRSDGERFTGKFLMSPGQVGELVADLVSTMAEAGVEVLSMVKAELVDALAKKVDRDTAEGVVERANTHAQEKGGPMTVVGLEGGHEPDGPTESAGEAAVFWPWPHSEFGGELFCRVKFQNGGPWDGETKDVPVAVAVVALATSAGDIRIEETPEEDE